MPKKLHDALVKQAKRKGMTGKRKDKYVYGAMRKRGWKPKKERSTLLTGNE